MTPTRLGLRILLQATLFFLLFSVVPAHKLGSHVHKNSREVVASNSAEFIVDTSPIPVFARDGACSKESPCPKGDCCNKL